MTDFDPTDPFGDRSPWDQAGQTQNQPTQEAPVTNQPVAANPAPNPFKIGFTLKAASGYDAEWLTPTVYGSTAAETAERGKDLLVAMQKVGLIDLTSQAAEYTRGQFKGGAKTQAAPAAQPSFNPASGQVQYGNQAPAQSGPPRPANVPDGWTYKEGTNKNGKPYKAWFPPRGVDASPIWV
jgi:hypothetical protein